MVGLLYFPISTCLLLACLFSIFSCGIVLSSVSAFLFALSILWVESSLAFSLLRTFLIGVLGAHNFLMPPIPTKSWAHYILYVYQEHASIHSRSNKQLLILSCVCMTCFTYTHSFQHRFKYLTLYFHDTCCPHSHPLFLQQIVIYIVTLSTYDMFLYTRILTNSSLYSHAFDLYVSIHPHSNTQPPMFTDWMVMSLIKWPVAWRLTVTKTFQGLFIVGLFGELGLKPQPGYSSWTSS